MKRIATTLLTLLVAGALTAQSTTDGQQGQYDVRKVTEVAAAALPTLRGLAEQTPVAIGLTAREAEGAGLAPPLRMFRVTLNALKAYAGGDPRSLLNEQPAFFYPVEVSGAVRSSITVKQRDGRWIATEFGQAELAQEIAAARASNADAILIRVPALNTFLLGTNVGGVFRVIPLTDIPGSDLRKGTPAPAEAVFTALAAVARRANGLPT